MSEESKPPLQGIGASRRRVEDARFIQGKGNYVDDIKLPGMLFGAFVRSPHAHARVKSIRAEAAVASPRRQGGFDRRRFEAAQTPLYADFGRDVQAVLADEKVLFQGQEVAFVVAEDRYAAADGAALVEVEYEELPPLGRSVAGDGRRRSAVARRP